MAEYIERDILLKAVEKMDRLDEETKTKYEYNKEGYILLLKNAPAADVAPVVHAHWEEGVPFHQCSNCNGFALSFDNEPYRKEILSNFCPHCGAIMEGMENDNATY